MRLTEFDEIAKFDRVELNHRLVIHSGGSMDGETERSSDSNRESAHCTTNVTQWYRK